MKPLFLFDVDGTITESTKGISRDMVNTLLRLPRIGLISGTDWPALRKMLWPLLRARPDIYVMPESGSACIRQSKRLYECLPRFDMQLSRLVFSSAEEALREIGIIPITDDVFLLRDSQITISIIGRSAPIEQKKAADPDGALRRKVIHSLTKKIPNLHYTLGGTSSIDIMEHEWDKRRGVLKFLEYLNLPPEMAVFYGDGLQIGHNDYPVTFTGVHCVPVTGPSDTIKKLEAIYEQAHR